MKINNPTKAGSFEDTIVFFKRVELKTFPNVSPAYGFYALALVKCSNEEGPGPRHNMKEDPGTSTLIMKREHGQEVPCDPGQVTSILGITCPPLPPPPPGQLGQITLPPPFRVHTPPLAPVPQEASLGESTLSSLLCSLLYIFLCRYFLPDILFCCIIHEIIQVVVYLDHCMCLPADSAASQISCYMSPSSPISACEGEGEGAPSSGFLIFWCSVASSAATSVISVSALASVSRFVPSLFALLCPME